MTVAIWTASTPGVRSAVWSTIRMVYVRMVSNLEHNVNNILSVKFQILNSLQNVSFRASFSNVSQMASANAE